MLHDINDFVNPKTGKTYRQENEEKTHNIPLGTLVETPDGLRLWVVDHERDCDESPLYGLSFDKNWKSDMYGAEYKILANSRVDHGYAEYSLKIISLEENQTIFDIEDLDDADLKLISDNVANGSIKGILPNGTAWRIEVEWEKEEFSMSVIDKEKEGISSLILEGVLYGTVGDDLFWGVYLN